MILYFYGEEVVRAWMGDVRGMERWGSGVSDRKSPGAFGSIGRG